MHQRRLKLPRLHPRRALASPLTRRQTLGLGGAAAIAPFARQATGALAQDEQAATGVFPDNRVLFYYGFPENENMGILGEYEPEALLERLYEQAAEYETVDSSRPVKVGFELIASVAQADAGEDGNYIADTDTKWLDLYTEFTAANGIELMLDVQCGRRDPAEDYVGLEPWLREPHVHLAIDPEFVMREDELPGVHIGQVTGAQVTEAQNWLANLAAEAGVPPKILMIHQFRIEMIEQKDEIALVAGVQLVIDEDGFGTPEEKRETYDLVITQQPIEYNGIKLFYQQDNPLMTAEEILALDPSPDLIMYQ